ncbi:hypothetical protein L6164_011051 [Bauhinia variegata]|uniref:Uncharacterized protein n=1 Tax=Bauhinia variegata TaxID=167791 RepID=A0ACB9P4L5_BAUVA|nr:hypothetical protein L6164_011051 [Bauhinia variegata]
MVLVKVLPLFILCWVFSLLCSRTKCGSSEVLVKFLKAPHTFSHLNSATFSFEALDSANGSSCSNCSFSCKLDNGNASACEARKVSYSSLQDGNHTFEVCSNGSQGLGCANYNWTIDTVPPTAYITASTTFTSAFNVSVNITFSELCTGGGSFGCASSNACNLLVYGAGNVIPSSLKILQPNLVYSLLISLSSTVQVGRAVLVMDKNFCTDAAGNSFTRTPSSTLYIHFDRRQVYVDLRTCISEQLLQLDRVNRTVQATNDHDKLKVYLYFSEPVLNSSSEIMSSLNINQGSLLPISGNSLGNRKFGFLIANISETAIVSLSLNENSIISRQGTQVSPFTPVTFLYDTKRPAVKLSTYNMKTREDDLQILIKFAKPVFSFNSSSISMTGGHLKSFQEINRSTYLIELQADDDLIFVSVPANVTHDVAGNKNLPSNVLQVRHYSVPLVSSVISGFASASFVLTSLAAAILTISTASLQNIGALIRSSILTVNPTRNLFRTICHIQVFALSRWLAVKLPVEYYEFARDLQWTIPYFYVPWENRHSHWPLLGSSPFGSSNSYPAKVSAAISNLQSEKNFKVAASVYGLPLTPSEYQLYFEKQNMDSQAEYIWDSRHPTGWTEFYRSMFWLAVICGGLIILHAFLLFILKLRKRSTEKQRTYGALTVPRFEIFLIFLALPSICKASAVLIKGGPPSASVVGILLLVFVSCVLLPLFLFLSFGITLGKLLQYKEVHQEGQKFHWYQELVRVTLGPGKRGQWTWKDQPNSVYLTIFGPLFEDLRGPPKYMLSQISGSSSRGDRIIASDDETEDAEAPFIQKLFGILRIYYVLLESIRRVSAGILAGAYVETPSSNTPTIIILSMSSFQLFFLVLKKPFIKKKVQLAEIIALTCEVGLFATCLVLSKKDFSVRTETKVGICMLALFLVGYLAQIINEWYALYRQTKVLDREEKSFFTGLKIASIGFLLYFIPQKYFKNLENRFPQNRSGSGETGNISLAAERYRSSGSGSSGGSGNDKPWLKRIRKLAKAASFGKEASAGPNDPSTSTTRWSGIWGTRTSSSSSDLRSKDSKPSGLYKDLEAIFASN